MLSKENTFVFTFVFWCAFCGGGASLSGLWLKWVSVCVVHGVCFCVYVYQYWNLFMGKYIKHALQLKLNQAKCLISKKTIDTWVKCRDLNAKMRWKEVFWTMNDEYGEYIYIFWVIKCWSFKRLRLVKCYFGKCIKFAQSFRMESEIQRNEALNYWQLPRTSLVLAWVLVILMYIV